MKKWLAKLKHVLIGIKDCLDEATLAAANRAPLTRLQRFVHFWIMVARSFSRTRCTVRAAALAYTSLLALIPMVFVVVSVSSSILKQEGGDRINHFIDKLLLSMTPPTASTSGHSSNLISSSTNELVAAVPGNTNAAVSVTIPPEPKTYADREEMVHTINGFISNIRSGTLGVTGLVVLVWLAISMLSSVETTFNDIWGVQQGRSWLVRIEKYGAVLFVGPLLLGVALGLTGSPHFESAKALVESKPIIGRLLFQFAPVALLCLTFALFYLLMPNTRVRWSAALAGGFVGGLLWHLNNYFSVLYISRWTTNNKIYGGVAIIPVFMVGLYVSWIILLFGAQVAYAYQNRAAYLQEKQAENINQRGREFIALRLMECVGQRFQRGLAPATVNEMADALTVPSRLVHQIMQTLFATRLVVEVAGVEPAYAPARPLEQINCHDILLALRAGQGQELTTRDDPARVEVFGEFERILAAEKTAASAVTVLAMVQRTDELTAASAIPMKAVPDRALID